MNLGDLIKLYRLVFERILSRAIAKESPYTRYYLGTSTPLKWKDIATSFGKTLKKMGKIEIEEPLSITVDNLTTDKSKPSECVWTALTPLILTLFIEKYWCTPALVRMSRQYARRPWDGGPHLWCWITV